MTDANEEFIIFFMEKHKRLISSIIRRYLIPNRYNADDINQYIVEKILQILKNKETKPNKIEDPEKYFKSCIEFYCIEYQRMHGYVFDLPKRPRKNCELDELTIKSKGFKYLKDLTLEESSTLLDSSFINSLFNDDEKTYSPVWNYLTGLLSPEEANVLTCIFSRNMTWSETAKELKVPQSTCWFRKTRALNKLSQHILGMTGRPSDNIKSILRMYEDE